MAEDPAKFVKLPRIHTVDERIAVSEKFPRIRDATIATIKKKEALKKKIADRDFQRELDRLDREKNGVPEGGDQEKKDMVEEDYIEKDFFSYHVMNEDPEMSKYLDYDGLVFPKPYETIKLGPDFIDKLWVSGFMDRSTRDGPKKVKAEQKKMALTRARKFDKFKKVDEDEEEAPLRLASDVVDDSEERAAAAKLKKANAVLENLLAGKDGKAKKKKGPLDSDSDSDDDQTVHSVGEDISALSSVASLKPEKVELTEEQKAARDKQSSDTKERKKRQEKEDRRIAAEKAKIAAIPKQFHPYLNQIMEKQRNLQKEAAMASLSDAAAKERAERDSAISFLSYDLDFVFDRERQEHEAAARIQQSWKRIGRLRPWKNIVHTMLAARTIQRIAKGMITRKWVARWFNTRNMTVGCIQANIRRYLSNKHLRPKLKHEWVCALNIQRIVRGKFGRLRSARQHYKIAAIHIQAVWRGVTARVKSDRLWLNKVVVPIQTMVRAKLARGGLDNMRKEFEHAAIMIQKRFRCYSAMQKVGDKLRNRENEYRVDNIAQLTSDGEHIQERIEKMIQRLLRKDFQGQAAETLKHMLDAMQDVYELENQMIEMIRQMDILSPRAITQGFYQELNVNCIDLRNQVTKQKIDCLFKKTLKVSNIDHLVEVNMLEIERVAASREAVTQFREWEYSERRARAYQRELLYRSRVKRQSIAEERRKWQVRYYTPDGKPDKRRRPGRPWDSAAFAGKEKETYSASNINIFADIPDSNKTKPGSKESIDQTLNTMSLQTYLQEVNAYEQMLNPIQEILQKNLGAPIGKPAPQDLGWGEEGKKMAPAQWKIGSMPASWHRPLSPGGTTAISAKELLAMKTKAAEEEEIAMALAWEQEELAEQAEREEEERLAKEEQARFLLSGGDPKKAKNRWGKLKNATIATSMVRSHRVPKEHKVAKGKDAASFSLTDPKRKLAALREAAEAERRRELGRENFARSEKRRHAKLQKRADLPPVTIPWALLDALDGAKRSFENEKAYMEMHHKI